MARATLSTWCALIKPGIGAVIAGLERMYRSVCRARRSSFRHWDDRAEPSPSKSELLEKGLIPRTPTSCLRIASNRLPSGISLVLAVYGSAEDFDFVRDRFRSVS